MVASVKKWSIRMKSFSFSLSFLTLLLILATWFPYLTSLRQANTFPVLPFHYSCLRSFYLQLIFRKCLDIQSERAIIDPATPNDRSRHLLRPKNIHSKQLSEWSHLVKWRPQDARPRVQVVNSKHSHYCLLSRFFWEVLPNTSGSFLLLCVSSHYVILSLTA